MRRFVCLLVFWSTYWIHVLRTRTHTQITYSYSHLHLKYYTRLYRLYILNHINLYDKNSFWICLIIFCIIMAFRIFWWHYHPRAKTWGLPHGECPGRARHQVDRWGGNHGAKSGKRWKETRLNMNEPNVFVKKKAFMYPNRSHLRSIRFQRRPGAWRSVLALGDTGDDGQAHTSRSLPEAWHATQ